MALQSEVSPLLDGDSNKDTQIEGETKSDDDSSSTDDDVDLEEGEILDSGGEAEEEKKDLTNSSLLEALDKNFLKTIEQLAKAEAAPPVVSKTASPHNSPHKVKKRPSKYLDHDQFENNSDQEDGWYSPSRKRKSSKFDAKPIDYRKELEAYRGTPPSSPDSKHREKRKKRSSKKSKKSGKKAIKRKDIKGVRVSKYIKEAMKHKICKFFKEGNCAKGSECGYSHASPLAFKKKELCKFYLSGHCNKGSDCTYMHGEFPCKFYHTGSECYAKDACRFSHSPLTEETKRILADYLRINRGDDDYDRKRRNSPSPEPRGPPPKRTCLLGSPPRHIREAEETKRWQEEMLLQQHNHPGFKIHISPSREDSSPPPFTKPNFYQETLPKTPSPKRRRPNPEAMNSPLSTSFPPPSQTASGYPLSNSVDHYPHASPDDKFVLIEDYLDEDEMISIKQEPQEVPDFSWSNIRGMDHNLPPVKVKVEPPFVDPAQQELDFTSDVKFDETTQFSEMESSIDCNVSSPPEPAPETTVVNKDSEEENENSNHEIKTEDKTTDDSCSAPEPVVSPIVIPSHLPKKQQELFKRIFQHQKKTEVAAAASDASNSPKHTDNNSESPVKEPEDTKEKNEGEKNEASLWYSSEDDDDDDTDEPLTDVLKKLQKEPPLSNPPVKVESNPPESIMALLNKAQQNTLERNKSVPDLLQKNDFFENLIQGNLFSGDSLQLPGFSTSEPKRRTLLPDPQPVIKKEPIVAPKDPRLKNRDPRTLASNVNNVLNLPKTLEQTVSQTSSSLVAQQVKSTTFTNSTTVISEPSKDIPYKLHGIYTKPPNYTPYIHASQSNPSLLKDPRLRKHLNLTNENGIEIKKEPDSIKNLTKEVPPMPKLLLAYDKDSVNINIFEPNPTSKHSTEESQDIKPIRSKLMDPRTRRRDSQNSSGSNTPPHLSIVENLMPTLSKSQSNFENEVKVKEEKKCPPVLEKSWVPPVLEQNWNVTIKQEVDSDTDDPSRLEIDESPQVPSIKVAEETQPVITKKATPTPASHLPRAIADPRMARLHNPVDSRRLRINNSESSNKNVELKKNHSSNENSVDASKTSPSDTTAAESENVKTAKNIPKKKSSEKSDEKKKTVHRNRKSSMDYASPLNSCDDSNSNKSLNYNSYNQRQPRTSSYATSDSSVSNNSTNSVTPESAPDFLSDNSNLECDNSSDVNLKDMFKTIDPTASPFC